MKKTLLLAIILFLAIFLAGAIVIFFALKENQKSASPDVPIQNDYGTKIVYTSNTGTSTSPFIRHCESIGGTFNECGNVCPPDADTCASVCAFTCEVEGRDSQGQNGLGSQNWEVYENINYSFRIAYPELDWEEYEDTSIEFNPKFNFYKSPIAENASLPLDHFSATSHVSVYPGGIATEGLFGQTRPFNLDLEIEVSEDSKLYVLDDGTPYAAYVRPENPPSPWSEAGFIWMRVEVNNLEIRCLRNGQEIEDGLCDPLIEGDTIVRSGSTNTDVWEKGKKIIQSFRFLEDATTKDDLIVLYSPEENETVSSPLEIEGDARGTWYFEASFPIVLTDWDGKIIAQGIAQAQDEWMTEDFVPFEAELEFESPYNEGDPEFMRRGSLILQKDNPSGLPENDDALEITVFFSGE